jgi:hypothetical protein
VYFIENPDAETPTLRSERVKKAYLGVRGRSGNPAEGEFLYITRVKYGLESGDSVASPTSCFLRFGVLAGSRETSKLQTP